MDLRVYPHYGYCVRAPLIFVLHFRVLKDVGPDDAQLDLSIVYT